MLVLAAAGGVGTLLVQLAARAGAEVTGAASTAEKALARRVARCRTRRAVYEFGLGTFDVVFDGVGGAVSRTAFEHLRPGGRMVSFGLASGSWSDVTDEEAAARSVTRVKTGRPDRTHTERALLAGLRPVIGQRFALERAADAHAAIESRATLGKTLLTTGHG